MFNEVSIRSISPIGGTMFVETLHAVDRREDWSACRSIPRAIRRQKQGHKQRMVISEKPLAFMINGVLHVHPEIKRQIVYQLGNSMERQIEKDLYSAMFVTSHLLGNEIS